MPARRSPHYRYGKHATGAFRSDSELTPYREFLVGQRAGRQGGVISVAQLHEIGLTRRQVGAWTRRGLLHHLHRGVYAYGTPKVLAPVTQVRAALMSFGPSAWVSHRSALGLLGLITIDLREIDISVANGRPRAGLNIHRVAELPPPREVGRHADIRRSTFARAMLEVAPDTEVEELTRIVHRAAQRKYDMRAVHDALRTHPRRPGNRRLRRAMRGYIPTRVFRSGFELEFYAAFLRRFPHRPRPGTNVQIGAWNIDVYLPKLRLAIELDSREYHRSVADMERDRLKDMRLAAMGILVIRVHIARWEQDPEAVLDDIAAVIAQRERAAA